jgi:hypothetical protein
LADRMPGAMESPTTKSLAQTSSCSPQSPTEEHRHNRQNAEWPPYPARGQSRCLFGDLSYHPGSSTTVSSYALPPAISERVGPIHIKNDRPQPSPLSTSCTDSRSPSSSHPLSLLVSPPNSPSAHSSIWNKLSHPGSFQMVTFRYRPSVRRSWPQRWIADQTASYWRPTPRAIRSRPPVQPNGFGPTVLARFLAPMLVHTQKGMTRKARRWISVARQDSDKNIVHS